MEGRFGDSIFSSRPQPLECSYRTGFPRQACWRGVGQRCRGVKDILVNSRRAHRRSKAGQEKEKEVLGAVRWVYVWQMWPEKWPPGSR